MKDTILLNKNENNKLCSECGEKYNIEKINNIISNNNKIKDSIYELELKIENIINNLDTFPNINELNKINKNKI